MYDCETPSLSFAPGCFILSYGIHIQVNPSDDRENEHEFYEFRCGLMYKIFSPFLNIQICQEKLVLNFCAVMNNVFLTEILRLMETNVTK